jgi:uncharacterized protein (TIGR02118 family)
VKEETQMFRMTVLYGHPTDPAEFDRYYNEVHVPLVQKVKGLTGFTITKFKAGPRGEPPPYYLMAALFADSQEAFNAAMSTPEGRAAGADTRNFATGGVTLVPGEDESIPLS